MATVESHAICCFEYQTFNIFSRLLSKVAGVDAEGCNGKENFLSIECFGCFYLEYSDFEVPYFLNFHFQQLFRSTATHQIQKYFNDNKLQQNYVADRSYQSFLQVYFDILHSSFLHGMFFQWKDWIIIRQAGKYLCQELQSSDVFLEY